MAWPFMANKPMAGLAEGMAAGPGTMDAAERMQVRAEESRVAFFVSAIFSFILFGTLIYVWSLFAPIAPRDTLNAWTGLIVAVILAILIMPLAYLVLKPSEEQIVRYWSPAGKVVAVAMDISIALSIWLLLPYASEGLRLLMVIFYMAAISGQVIATAESLGTNAFGILVLPGSVALFYFMTPGEYSTGIAIFCLAFGGLLMMAALMLKRAVRTAFLARLRAEEAANDLACALEKAEQERDSKARFIAAASHDLRQPLHAASLYFEQSQIARDEAMRARAVQGVRTAFQAAGSLLDSLLDHLKLGSDTVSLHLVETPLSQLYSRLDQLYSAEAALAGMTLRFRPTRHAVRADLTLLVRAAGNLISNAIKHSRGKRILVSSRTRGGKVVLLVIDDGVGSPVEDREAIFEEYVQGRGVALDPRGGLGLGLASSRRVAELHGGTLTLVQDWTGGAAFALSLEPGQAAAGIQSFPQAAAIRAAPALAGHRLLIVEDVREAGEALASLLHSWGMEAVCATSVQAAEQACQQTRFDGMICDWRLSLSETGADAIAAVRKSHPDIPVLVLTGDGSPDTVQQILSLNVALMHKPATPRRLNEGLTALFEPRAGDVSCIA